MDLAHGEEFDRRGVLARARERARTALDLVDGDRGQLGRRHLELKRRPRIRRSREEAVEEVEVLQDDGVREPQPEPFRASSAAQVAVAAVHAREGSGNGRHARVALDQQPALGAFRGARPIEESRQRAPQDGAVDLSQSGRGRARFFLAEEAEVDRERVPSGLVVFHFDAEPARRRTVRADCQLAFARPTTRIRDLRYRTATRPQASIMQPKPARLPPRASSSSLSFAHKLASATTPG